MRDLAVWGVMENRINKRFDCVDERLDRLEITLSSLHVELTETQETVDFPSSKTIIMFLYFIKVIIS